jgi:hypothetical protein
LSVNTIRLDSLPLRFAPAGNDTNWNFFASHPLHIALQNHLPPRLVEIDRQLVAIHGDHGSGYRFFDVFSATSSFDTVVDNS